MGGPGNWEARRPGGPETGRPEIHSVCSGLWKIQLNTLQLQCLCWKDLRISLLYQDLPCSPPVSPTAWSWPGSSPRFCDATRISDLFSSLTCLVS